MKKNILITTTDSLQNYTIEEYIGYIEASSTIGSGFITDIFSSWSDTFGVSSNIIENKLAIIKKEVIKKLEEKAASNNCNAIIGLHIDIDEISSNQKMIFMITASGTAVKCKTMKDGVAHSQVSGEMLNNKLYKSKEYVEQLQIAADNFRSSQAGAYDFSIQVLSIIISNNFYNFIENACVECLLAAALSEPKGQVFESEYREVFENMDEDELITAYLNETFKLSNAKENLLNLRKSKSYEAICKYFSSISSYNIIKDFLSKSNDYFAVIIVYPLLKGFKEYYHQEDMQSIDDIITTLKGRHWNELKIVDIDQNSRICECGSIIGHNHTCECGADNSISLSTFKDKKVVIKKLENISKELKLMKW